MGIVVSRKDFWETYKPDSKKVVIWCSATKKASEEFKDCSVINLGKELADKLRKLEVGERKFKLVDEMDKLISKRENDTIILDNLDLLFNPSYEIDILKYFGKKALNKNIIVIWSGKYEANRLIYAEEGYSDYKSYNIKDYDIICVK